MCSRAVNGSPVETSTRSVSRLTKPGIASPTALISPAFLSSPARSVMDLIKLSGSYFDSRRSSVWPASEIRTPRIVVIATSIPAKLFAGFSGMRETFRTRFLDQGRDFVVILCDGPRTVKLCPLRVECPATNMPTLAEQTTLSPLQLRRILLPTDFSGCANYALPYAAAIARAAKAAVICVNVVEPIVPAVGYSGMAEAMPIAEMSEQMEDSAERELPDVMACEDLRGVKVEEGIVQ